MKHVSVDNKVRLGKSCWNYFIKKSKLAEINSLHSESSYGFRKHLHFQFVQRNSYTKRSKWKHSKHNFCREGLLFEWQLFPRKLLMHVWRFEQGPQVESGTNWKKRPVDDLLNCLMQNKQKLPNRWELISFNINIHKVGIHSYITN